jgi:thiol-disulfide isomerase/thioredoxin
MRLPSLSSALTALRDSKRWRRWAFEVLLIAAIISVVSLWQNRGLPEGQAPALAGISHRGLPIDLAEKVGAGSTASAVTRRATLVVFWAIWCPVCRAEEGNIIAVAEDWPVISVAMQSGDAFTVGKYLQERGNPLPALLDEEGAHAAAWRVRSVPAHFIIDPAGNIRFRVVGYATSLGLRVRLWWANNTSM